MEKLEIKKNIERKLAFFTCALFLLLISLPSIFLTFSDRKKLLLLSLAAMTIVVLYKRIRRLNYKLYSLTK